MVFTKAPPRHEVKHLDTLDLAPLLPKPSKSVRIFCLALYLAQPQRLRHLLNGTHLLARHLFQALNQLVMHNSARSSPARSCGLLFALNKSVGAASKEEPMRFCTRSISNAPVTTLRIERIASHFPDNFSSRHSLTILGMVANEWRILLGNATATLLPP